MLDKYNREISYLRISLTDRCNLRCRYCMPASGVCKLNHNDILSFEDLLEIIEVSTKLGVHKIRLTGGEPLVRKGVIDFCKQIKAIDGIDDLALTTNGILLNEMADDLKSAGVDRVNISLDTLSAARYDQITRGGSFADAMGGISKALNAGFKKIKLNTVLLGGFNDDEIPAMVDLTKDYDIDVRFIELMHMPDTSMPEEAYIPNSVVLKKVKDLEYKGIEGVAQIYQKEGYKGRVGLISPVSCSFCKDCNRIRLTAEGFIKPCLHSKDEISIKGLHGSALEEKLKEAILAKPKEHQELDAYNISKSQRDMNKIGG
ncbi:MAG: GTP 3',8-cyclase MoaA [Bacillota bacterium]|nr:GTP 3',8-cyclase MoaA [Bacillota bacterium]